MEYLLNYGISEAAILQLKEIDTKNELENNYRYVISSIDYLKSIGVTIETIENILLNDYTYLIPGEKYLKKALKNMNIEHYVQALNKNIVYIKYLNFY